MPRPGLLVTRRPPSCRGGSRFSGSSHRSSNPLTGADRTRTGRESRRASNDPGIIARRANEQEDCSLSARHCLQTERQWWPMEGRCLSAPTPKSKLLSPASASRPPRGRGGAARWCAETAITLPAASATVAAYLSCMATWRSPAQPLRGILDAGLDHIPYQKPEPAGRRGSRS
jgi:hypothetical protein